MNATLQQHLARAGKVAAVLKKHGADIADLAGDAAKLVAIAGDLHEALKEPAVVTPAAAQPLEKLPPKITAPQAATHIAKHGLTSEQRAVFDRETQLFG